jgi:hypothetical protein
VTGVLVEHSAARLRKRQLLSRLWAAMVIAWSLIRTVVIWAALGSYGFNPWIYLCIDLACSSIDAYTTPKMVVHFIDDQYRPAIRCGIWSLIAYIVPDVYIFEGTRTLPTRVIVILCAVIATMLTLAVASVVHKVRVGRAVRARVEHEAAAQHRA